MKLITGADSDGGLRLQFNMIQNLCTLERDRTELFEFKFKPQLQIKQSGGYLNIEGKGAYTLDIEHSGCHGC